MEMDIAFYVLSAMTSYKATEIVSLVGGGQVRLNIFIRIILQQTIFIQRYSPKLYLSRKTTHNDLLSVGYQTLTPTCTSGKGVRYATYTLNRGSGTVGHRDLVYPIYTWCAIQFPLWYCAKCISSHLK